MSRTGGLGSRFGALAARLALAFVVVALVAIGLLAGLTIVAARSSVDSLVAAQRAQSIADITAGLGDAYQQAGGWAGADLRPAAALTAGAGARLDVRDVTGRAVPSPVLAMQQLMNRGGSDAGDGPAVAARVVVAGQPVGTAEIGFPAGAPAAAARVRDALIQTVAIGAALGVTVALVVAVAIAKRITRPLAVLTNATRRLSTGDSDARVGPTSGPREITELGTAFDRMADTLQQQDTLRRALVTDVAHELRTPVTILQASCEEMADGLVEPTRERLASLHQEVLRLGRVVEDLEHLAAAEAARLQLDRRPVDLAAVTAQALDLLRPHAHSSGVTVRDRLHPAELSGDPDRLHQVATNLLANAIKFTPPGGTVTVSVGVDGPLAELVVTDTGPGIDPDELPHVFDRFWRGRAAIGTPGSGVGLTVVAELVRAHGGRVDVTASPGTGATFTARFPISPA